MVERREKKYYIYANKSELYYDKPIVVMTGPDCISACDYLVGAMSKFPQFTIIGRDTNASFSGVRDEFFEMGDSDYLYKYIPISTARFIDDLDKPLLRTTDFLDVPVWFEKEDLANDIDTIREKAIEIILEKRGTNFFE